MSSKTTVLIVEDHQLFREGLKSLLSHREDLTVAGEAQDGIEAIKVTREIQPDLILLDISMPRMGGISVIKEVKREFPETKILALTIHESDQYVLEAFEAGADGYCIKDANRDELMMAIDSVLMGKTFISPDIADDVMEGFLAGRKTLKEHVASEEALSEALVAIGRPDTARPEDLAPEDWPPLLAHAGGEGGS